MRTISMISISAGMGLGLLAAVFDATSHSDDASQITLSLLLAGGAVAGTAIPGRLLRTALIVGTWTPAIHVIVKLMGRPDNITPDTAISHLLLLFVCLGAAWVGALIGTLIRNASGVDGVPGE